MIDSPLSDRISSQSGNFFNFSRNLSYHSHNQLSCEIFLESRRFSNICFVDLEQVHSHRQSISASSKIFSVFFFFFTCIQALCVLRCLSSRARSCIHRVLNLANTRRDDNLIVNLHSKQQPHPLKREPPPTDSHTFCSFFYDTMKSIRVHEKSAKLLTSRRLLNFTQSSEKTDDHLRKLF